jgi:predicted AlkP superfamily pyrophosphatase or phosphodiesterase
MVMLNSTSLDTLCAALAYAMNIEAPACAAAANADLCTYIDNALGGQKCNRIFMYNPDAVAQWIYKKYPSFLSEVTTRTDLSLPLCTVMPSVTPVCFGTMYTGAQPAVHGIQAYVKPVITIDTLFDVLLRNGKKPAIVSTAKDSMSKIYLEREMDYYIYDTVEEVNAKASQLIMEDTYDFIAVYNGNYDSVMHKFGPESSEALGELRANARTFGVFFEMIKTYWGKHNTLVGFAMDHGCHEIDDECGSHGLDMEEDLNITHFYQALPARDNNV